MVTRPQVTEEGNGQALSVFCPAAWAFGVSLSYDAPQSQQSRNNPLTGKEGRDTSGKFRETVARNADVARRCFLRSEWFLARPLDEFFAFDRDAPVGEPSHDGGPPVRPETRSPGIPFRGIAPPPHGSDSVAPGTAARGGGQSTRNWAIGIPSSPNGPAPMYDESSRSTRPVSTKRPMCLSGG